jgi:mannose-6-phosphate isomerase-like protein (cupin superfamily)
MPIKDIGPQPQVFDIEAETKANENYRTVVWTGAYLQVTLMSIPPGGDVGLEMHPDTDQFLRLDAGKGRCQLGPSKDTFDVEQDVEDGWSIQVPAGTWHNVTNTGDEPMQLYAIYAPVHHAPGKIHKTKEDDEKDEQDEPPSWAKNVGSAEDEQA